MKHVGKMKNNGAKIVIAYRTLPGDPYSALVIGTQALTDGYHDSLMALVESDMAQQADELADVMAVRRFTDGSNMLEFVHSNGFLRKVSTDGVIVTPDNKTSIQLNDLNNLIAEQKGVRLSDLSIKDGSNSVIATLPKDNEIEVTVPTVDTTDTDAFQLSPVEMRSRADALYKEAAKLRKMAEELDPPKKKSSKTEEV